MTSLQNSDTGCDSLSLPGSCRAGDPGGAKGVGSFHASDPDGRPDVRDDLDAREALPHLLRPHRRRVWRMTRLPQPRDDQVRVDRVAPRNSGGRDTQRRRLEADRPLRCTPGEPLGPTRHDIPMAPAFKGGHDRDFKERGRTVRLVRGREMVAPDRVGQNPPGPLDTILVRAWYSGRSGCAISAPSWSVESEMRNTCHAVASARTDAPRTAADVAAFSFGSKSCGGSASGREAACCGLRWNR